VDFGEGQEFKRCGALALGRKVRRQSDEGHQSRGHEPMAQRQPEGGAYERLRLLRRRPETHPGGGKLAACGGDPWLILKHVPERQRLCLELCRLLAIPLVSGQQGKLTEQQCLVTPILERAGMRKPFQ
jgi:hypothetical protein